MALVILERERMHSETLIGRGRTQGARDEQDKAIAPLDRRTAKGKEQRELKSHKASSRGNCRGQGPSGARGERRARSGARIDAWTAHERMGKQVSSRGERRRSSHRAAAATTKPF